MTQPMEGTGLTAEQLENLYNPDRGGEHPQITRAQWRAAVTGDETALGYWQWLAHKLAEEMDALVERQPAGQAAAALPVLRIAEGPVFSTPMDASAGLYIQVLSQHGRVSQDALLAFVREAVAKAGFDPDGNGLVGLPTVHGITALTYSMWFYDRAQAAQDAAATPEEADTHYLVIQEGGTSAELYVHSSYSEADAQEYRLDCVSNGAYRTSPCIEVPASLANHPQFYDIAEQLVRATTEIDFPDEEPGASEDNEGGEG
jgi:hypothetical protein